MNTNWIDFLRSKNAVFTEDSDIIFSEQPQDGSNTITAITHLSVIEVSGKDASQFLQGQLTCNVSEITENNSFFAAFCNPKGRTISTLLILKNAATFLIIVPAELAEKVLNKLKMYILRSEVQLNDISGTFCLMGVNTSNPHLLPSLPKTRFEVSNKSEIIIKFPSSINRYFIISSVTAAKTLWTQLTENQKVSACNSATWRYQDISAGIAWLSESTSEDYIPQMLNIDKFDGISFNKGCYTGQEIIARTHYLGKAKRELFLAECDKEALIDNNTYVFRNDEKQALGKIISIEKNNQHYRLLLIMPTTDVGLNDLKLNNLSQDKINILDIQKRF